MQEKIVEWVDIYLKHIERVTPQYHVEHEEGYKFLTVNTFQQHFDLETPNLADMLDRAIYHNNLSMGAMYFPRKMLLHYATEFPEETRTALRDLFDESKPVGDRITQAAADFDAINANYAASLGQNPVATYMGLRFLSLLLGLYAPALYNPIKPREWKVYARYLDADFQIPNRTLPGVQYEILSRYIEPLREYLQQVPRIKELKDELTASIEFKDPAYRWMTQDVIYVASRAYAATKTMPQSAEQDIPEINHPAQAETFINTNVGGMEFPLEKYLEHFMIDNWKSVDFGERLELYQDPDGAEPSQFTTDVGIIDILARDANGNIVVLELKRGQGHSAVVGQILSYMNWVDNNLCEEGKKSRGIIIVSKAHPALASAQAAVSDRVAIKLYDVQLSLSDHK